MILTVSSRRLWPAALICAAAAILARSAGAGAAEGAKMKAWVDPVTRYVHLAYRVPPGAPDEVTVVCAWSPAGKDAWRPAQVTPFLSETGLRFTPEETWKVWGEQGRVVERRASGLRRKVVWNPYPQAHAEGRVDADFRVQVQAPDGRVLTEARTRVQADNSDVVAIEDWTKVLQRGAVSTTKDEATEWWLRTGMDAAAGVSLGNALYGDPDPELALRPLTYPLDLRGWYALFVRSVPHVGAVSLRLTGDERADTVYSHRPYEEVFWRWSQMDRQHLVVRQTHTHQGYGTAHVDYVRLVPLSPALVRRLDARLGGKRDKLVAGYFEPYSWAFVERVQETLQHREPLVAFAQAGVHHVHIQVGRFGDKAVYESRKTDTLVHSTIGDPMGTPEVPTTDNVGRMQQYTNTLDAEIRYARELGMMPHANFGGTCCYPGTPAESEFSRQHPDWRRGYALRYEVPEVQEYILRLYRETLDIGAPGLSIDFCRYPEGIDKPETCTAFFRKLKALRDEFARARRKPVPLVVRFPGQGVRLWKNFDYATWVKEGLVDTLCPSNIQARHMHFDIRPYVDAVRGTPVKLLPVVDGLHWGLEMPGPFLRRVSRLYDAGVDGIYVYQADARVLGWPADRRCLRLLGSSSAVHAWWERHERARTQHSKGIYITPTHTDVGDGLYHRWDRLRVWLEGIPMGAVELYLDGELVNRYEGPHYVLGSEEYEADTIIPAGEHHLLVRARDGDGWLEQTFTVSGAG